MSLKTRLPKINQIANDDTTREVHRRNKFHFVYHVNSTRNSGQFQVIFNWTGGKYPTLTARLWSFNQVENPHPANNSKTVCYQALGAIKRMCQEQGKTISFCETEQIAKKVKNFGGEIVKIINPGGGTVWAVVKSPKVILTEQGFSNRLERNVELMRGPIEMGIE